MNDPLGKVAGGFDSQTPVVYLAIRQWSESLKHLTPRTGPPVYRVSIFELDLFQPFEYQTSL